MHAMVSNDSSPILLPKGAHITTNSDEPFVLLTTDFSELGDRAIPHAARLAKARRLPIRLLHVIDALTTGDEDRFAPNSAWEWRVTDLVQKGLARVAATISELGVEVEPVFRAGSPWREILRELESGAVAGVISTHGYGAVARFLVGSCAYKVIRSTPVPLLIVGRDTPDGPYKNCLIPVPPTGAYRALVNALRWPMTFGADVEVMHAVDPGHGAAGVLLGEDAVSKVVRERVRVANEQMDELTAVAHGQGITSSGHVVELVRPAVAIVERAKEIGAGLIVMPAHRYSRVQHFFLGSVTEEVIRRTHVPVLIFRPPEEGA